MSEVKNVLKSTEKFFIKNETDVFKANLYLKTLISDLDGNTKGIIEVAFSELTTNLIKYSTNSQILFELFEDKLVIKTINVGNLELLHFMDGITTQNSLGIGLGMIGRSADEFYYKLTPVEIVWVKYIKPKSFFYNKKKFNYATKTEYFGFNENEDCIIKIELPSFLFFSVVNLDLCTKNSLETYKIISKFIKAHYFLKLDDIFYCLKNILPQLKLERISAGFLKLWKTKNCLELFNIGSVDYKIFSTSNFSHKISNFAGNSYNISSDITFLTSDILRENTNDLVVQIGFPSTKAVIAMFSNGISNEIKIDESYFELDPSIYIDNIFNKYKKSENGSLLLIRCS